MVEGGVTVNETPDTASRASSIVLLKVSEDFLFMGFPISALLDILKPDIWLPAGRESAFTDLEYPTVFEIVNNKRLTNKNH